MDNALIECEHPIFLQERMSGQRSREAFKHEATVEEIKDNIKSSLGEVRYKPNPSTHDTIIQCIKLCHASARDSYASENI